MQMITVEVDEAAEHMDTLIDTVLVGGEVVMTQRGEPVVSIYLRGRSPDASEDRLRATAIELFEQTLNYLRGRLDPSEWLLN
jgi:antitoxin (DNA-binding transcriptional repressor) of toxin-antitoxin stability system